VPPQSMVKRFHMPQAEPASVYQSTDSGRNVTGFDTDVARSELNNCQPGSAEGILYEPSKGGFSRILKEAAPYLVSCERHEET
jgi:hypothetical protein